MKVLWLLPWVLVYVNPTTLEATDIGRYETEKQCVAMARHTYSSFCEFRPELVEEP